MTSNNFYLYINDNFLKKFETFPEVLVLIDFEQADVLVDYENNEFAPANHYTTKGLKSLFNQRRELIFDLQGSEYKIAYRAD